MQKFIGLTSHVWYYSTFTNININSQGEQHTIKIYIIPPNIKCNSESVDTTLLDTVWIKEMNCENIETEYDASGYLSNHNENFKLLVNGKCVHASQYTQKYLIEFKGSFVLTEVSFIDH